MNDSGKSEQEHVPHSCIKSDVSRCSHAINSTARKCTRNCAAIRPIVVFHSSGQVHTTTVFCKITVRRSKFCPEFSAFTWLKISRCIPFVYKFRRSSNRANKLPSIF